MTRHCVPIKDWPKEDRPREKLLKYGEHTLTDSELLAIILRSGEKGLSAVDLARKILAKFRTFRNLSHTDQSEWEEFRGLGLGNVKISQIKAALEIGRRFQESEVKDSRPKIGSPAEAAALLMPRMRDLKKEVFKVIFLNSQNRVIAISEAGEGTVNQIRPLLREIFHSALQNFAAFLICCHNHPSGDPQPSEEDKKFTQELVTTGEILLINTIDHIIIGNDCYFSFADEGLI
jgi:DNA repair protein RadC